MSASVTGTTKILGIFGDPVGYSLSPRMHNAAFRALGLDMMYLPFEVKREKLQEAMEGIRALGLVGVNLTHPHKVAALASVDDVDDEAVEIGAVNTVVNRGGILKGYNTDGAGFVRSLKDDYGFDPEDKRIVVFGAGGAGRAICLALSREKPERLVIVNRTLDKAEALARKVGGFPLSWSDPHLEGDIAETHLVVNATSVSLDLDPNWISEQHFMYEILYNQNETSFLRAVQKKGVKIGEGLSLLLHQGALAFELWTGEEAPVEAMRRTLGDSVKKQPVGRDS